MSRTDGAGRAWLRAGLMGGAALILAQVATSAAAATYFFGASSGAASIGGSFTIGDYLGEHHDNDFVRSVRQYAVDSFKFSEGGAALTDAQGGGSRVVYSEFTYGGGVQGYEIHADNIDLIFGDGGITGKSVFVITPKNEYDAGVLSTSFKSVFVDGGVTPATTGPMSASGDKIGMAAYFTPNYGLSLDSAATLGGFTGFNWQQTIHWPTQEGGFIYAVNDPTKPLTGTFSDPVPGGYTYQLNRYPEHPGASDSYPFYYSNSDPESSPFSIKRHESASLGQSVVNTLDFYDAPADPCLPGSKYIQSTCGGSVAVGDLSFDTYLVGVKPGNTASDPLYHWSWKTTFNGFGFDGQSGTGGSVLANFGDVDPLSGTGGTTILSIDNAGAAAPEPAFWAILISGFGLLGARLRLRRRVCAA